MLQEIDKVLTNWGLTRGFVSSSSPVQGTGASAPVWMLPMHDNPDIGEVAGRCGQRWTGLKSP